MIGKLDILYLDKVLNGDKEAFRYFIKTYQDMAYSISLSMVKNDVDARDVVQNSFIKAYRKLKSFKREAKFSTWFYKIVVNESLVYLRKKRNQNKKEKLVEETPVVITNPIVYANFDKSEKVKKIEIALSKLKPKEALLIKLYYLHEHTMDEIIKMTGFSASNVKVLLFRGRKSFKKYYH